MFVVAHRTPPTAQECAALAGTGVRVFELDIQLGRDGRLVVSHFLPLFGVRGWLENDNWRVRWRSSADPELLDAIARIPSTCDVLLDPKERHPHRRAELIARVRDLPDPQRYVVSTSEIDDLANYRAAGLRTWRTLKNVAEFDALVAGGTLPDEGVSVRHSILTPDRTARLRRLTPTVVAWTVNDEIRARRLVEWGVGGITTDRPAIITRI